MPRRWRSAFAAIGLAAIPAAAHDVISTKLMWTQDISRIVYRHCGNCHREGGTAMPLMTYDDARPWAKAIRDEVLARRMPPWGAVKGVGSFRDDPSLSQIEIDMIVNWVEGGAPKGDDIYLPPQPAFPSPAPLDQPKLEGVLNISSGTPHILDRAIVATGIRPHRLATGAWLDVTAAAPDGSVAHLIWIRDWRPQWERTYYFLHSLRLAKGTRIAVYSNQPADAALTLDGQCVQPARDNKSESSGK